MSTTPSSSVKCELHLTHSHLTPGDAVEGAVVIDAASAFDVSNIHIKVVGKEEVYAMVDQVRQSKTQNVQFGISSQDYVYYREIVTLAGALMTRKEGNGATQSPTVQELEGHPLEDEREDDAAGEEPSNPRSAVEVLDDDDGGSNFFRYNESVCVRPGVAQQNKSFATSQLAAAEGVSVRFPAGHYVYPFRFLPPATLPPSYDTGICVKDGQYSNSQAALHYYVKVYVWSPTRVQLASARADFVMGAPQSDGDTSAAPVSSGANNANESGKREVAGPASSSPSSGRPAKLSASSPVSGRTVHCVFPVMGTCSCMATDAKLKVDLTIASESLQFGRDSIAVTCTVASNTSRKALRGLKIQLIQVLSFETGEARVTMRKAMLEHHISGVVQPGKGGVIAGHTSVLPSHDDLMPTMTTSGLQVRYTVRVELVASHVDQAYYEFDNITLTGAGTPGEVAPSSAVGLIHFTALPRGRLTRREAFYAIPLNPAEAPVLANLTAPLSRQGSRSASRRASRLNSLAATPK